MSSDEITYPVAETFYSIQGEGQWAGTPMYFIRFAGCNVGKPRVDHGNFPVYRPELTECTAFDGVKFVCDTDYRMTERLTVAQLVERVEQSGAIHVVFTGGEPLMHDLEPLVKAMPVMIHLETSGTKPIPACFSFEWVTCSPKQGFLDDNAEYINEFKFLVAGPEEIEAISFFLRVRKDLITSLIWLQPIDFIGNHEASMKVRDLVVQAVLDHPWWRVSLQLHKILEVR